MDWFTIMAKVSKRFFASVFVVDKKGVEVRNHKCNDFVILTKAGYSDLQQETGNGMFPEPSKNVARFLSNDESVRIKLVREVTEEAATREVRILDTLGISGLEIVSEEDYAKKS